MDHPDDPEDDVKKAAAPEPAPRPDAPPSSAPLGGCPGPDDEGAAAIQRPPSDS